MRLIDTPIPSPIEVETKSGSKISVTSITSKEDGSVFTVNGMTSGIDGAKPFYTQVKAEDIKSVEKIIEVKDYEIQIA